MWEWGGRGEREGTHTHCPSERAPAPWVPPGLELRTRSDMFLLSSAIGRCWRSNAMCMHLHTYISQRATANGSSPPPQAHTCHSSRASS
eukprot:scaffold8775_cov129-Isochrysis_galbana.AAC.3